jgi:dTDP-4-amino-4,6-dideoxygalactose transaminase
VARRWVQYRFWMGEPAGVMKVPLFDLQSEYPMPIHLQPAYSSLGYPAGTFCNAERACEHVLSLPLFPCMTAEQVNYVAASVLEGIGKK